MKNRFNRVITKTILIAITLLFIFCPTSPNPALAGQNRVIHSGQIFPEVILPAPQTVTESNYLGIRLGQAFTPSQINADVVLIEFLNVHCPHCIEQAPSYNKLYNYIQKHPENSDRLKIIAIAVGNLTHEVDTFKSNYNILFPVFADTNFAIWGAIGGKVSPFSVIIRQRHSTTDSHSAAVVCATHSGTNHRYRKIYSQLVDIMEMSDDEVAEFVQDKITEQPPEPEPDSDEALSDQAYHALRQLGRVTSFTAIDLDPFDHVYRARIFKDKQSNILFAKVVTRSPVCDVCHEVKLIYIFNGAGEIIEIVPLSISKKGNVPWSIEDINRLRKQLIGRNLKYPQPFNPEIDAITSATISTSVIYDSISQGRKLVEMLESNNQLE